MLNLADLESRDFTLSERDGLVLVQPAPLKNLNRSKWETVELPYRSVVIEKETGKLVSAGFPKFFNYGEGGPSHIENSRLRKALETGQFVFTEKIDGSLAIRYVYEGKVRWRTRGTLNDTDFTEAIAKTAEKYPLLLNPEFGTDKSMLFEFVHPLFQVVLQYPEADLIYIGCVEHNTFYLHTYQELCDEARLFGLNVVTMVTFTQNIAIETLLSTVSAMMGQEGLVARINKEQTLIKLKGADYLMRHRLRFSLNAKTIRQICIENSVNTVDDFEDWLKESGADWELVADIKPLVEKFVITQREAVDEFAHLSAKVWYAQRGYPDRGDFARQFANLLPATHKSPAFSLLDGKTNRAWEMFREAMLDIAFEKVDTAESLC